MNTQEYVAAVKAKRGLTSDYALSKELGISRQAVSRYQKGHGTFDDEVSDRVARVLGIHPGIVRLDMQRERAKSPEDQAIWTAVLEKFSMGFEWLLSGAGPLWVSNPEC